MKIIYIANSRIPTKRAHGYQIAKMCEEFGKAKVETELWLSDRNNQIKEDLFPFYNIEKTFKVKTIKSFDFLKYDKYFGRLSFWLQKIFFLARLIFQKPDKKAIIYTREAGVARLFSGKKYQVILELHSWPENGGFLFYRLLKKLPRIIVISKSLKEILILKGFNPDKISVLPDGVDLEKFDIDIEKGQAREKLCLPRDKNLIVYTGHLYKWKGADTLLQAVPYLGADEQIVIVGGAEADIEKLRKNNKLANIIVAGHQKHQLIPFYLKAADVLVLPNVSGLKISENYTSPLKLFEYMAAARPIAASSLPSIREILDEENCLFFEPGNAKDLAAKIGELLSDKDLARKLANKARQDVQKYSWEVRTKEILRLIDTF